MNMGKLDIVKNEMKRLNIEIPGISELHWKGSGYFKSDDYMVYYSGNESIRRNGVAFIANKKITTASQWFNPINDRVISIHMYEKPCSLTILQVYGPTTDAKQENIEKFYHDRRHLRMTHNLIEKEPVNVSIVPIAMIFKALAVFSLLQSHSYWNW